MIEKWRDICRTLRSRRAYHRIGSFGGVIMPQQYYTLEQAAQILQINPEQLKEMARKKEIRAFQDRSGWRFRSQEIDEMARERGFGSDPELPLGEALKGKPGDSGHGKEVFNFSLDPSESDEVPLGKDPSASSGHGPRSGSGSGSRKTGSSKSSPKAASDSDVRLVMDGGDVNFAAPDAGKPSASKGPISPPPKAPISPPPGKPGSSKSRKAPMVQDESGVRIVPLDKPSDSDVKIEPSRHDSDISTGKRKPTKKASDSDIRIEEAGQSGKGDQMVTEEIDLDAEQRKAAEAGAKSGRQRPRPGSSPALPTASPFELSETDIEVKKPAAPQKGGSETDSSSDFELQPMKGSSDEISLSDLSGGKAKTGISLQDPADSGISLVPESSEELQIKPEAAKPETDSSSDFDLNVEGDSSPREGSSSEFELSLQDDDASPTEGSSSEFELSLDPEGSDLVADEGSSDLALEKQGADSDSEFELTLDDSGGLSVEDSSESDSDFAVNEDSGSEAVALDEGDTDLESAEFDLSLESGEESGSQVVPLEEEEADEGAATVQRRVPAATAEGEEGAEDIGEELDDDLNEAPAAEEEVETAAAPVAAAPPADWGVAIPLVSLLSTIILFFVMLMGFELIQGMWGYHSGNKVSSPIVRFFAKTFTDEKLPD